MCNLCTYKNGTPPDTLLTICEECTNFENLKYFINLLFLNCGFNEGVKKIPKTLTKLQFLYCSLTDITKLPTTLINLVELDCSYCDIHILPSEYTKLVTLYCNYTYIRNIPKELINLRSLITGDEVEVPLILINLNFTNDSYITLRQKTLKKGFVKLSKIYKLNKSLPKLWKIAEYYTAKKYAPKNIMKYINLD